MVGNRDDDLRYKETTGKVEAIPLMVEKQQLERSLRDQAGQLE